MVDVSGGLSRRAGPFAQPSGRGSRFPEVRRSASLTPQAFPSQTFVPAAPAQTQGAQRLNAFAESLAPLSRELGAFARQRRAQAQEEQEIKGQAAFFRNNEQGFAEGVRRGEIPATASPFFMKGYKEAQGSVEGVRLSQRFQAAFMDLPNKENLDDEAYEQFVSGFVRENVTTDDPDILRGLLPHVQQLFTTGATLANKERERRVYEGAVQTFSARGAQLIDDAVSEGLASVDGTDFDTTHAVLMALRQEALGIGIRAEDFDESYVDLVAAKALENKDAELLASLLKRTVPGTSHAFSDTPEGRDALNATSAQIEVRLNRDEAELSRQEKERRKREIDEVTKGILDHLFEDPQAPIPNDLLERADKVKPKLRVSALEWQKKITDAPVTEDPVAVAQVQRDIIDGGGTQAVVDAFDRDIIKSPDTFRTLFNFADAKTSPEKTSRALTGTVYRRILDTIRQRTTPPDFFQGPFDPGGMTDAGVQLTADYELLLLDFLERNPEASLADIRRAQSEIGALVLQGIEEPTPDTGDINVQRPGGIEGTSPTLFGEFEPFDRAGARQFLDSFSELERKMIAGAAARQGLETEAYAARLLETIRQGGRPVISSSGETTIEDSSSPGEAPEPAEAASEGEPQEPEEGTQLSALSFAASHMQPLATANDGQDLGAGLEENPAANTLLNLIGFAEAPGGYNQLFGETPGQHSTNLTATALDALADRTGTHTAAGRYQIIASNLRPLAERLGLDLSEPFTPAVQDAMGLALLEEKGLNEFLAGTLSAEDFANQLAQVWDSLPVVSGPRKGLRFASDREAPVTVESILETLEAIRRQAHSGSPS